MVIQTKKQNMDYFGGAKGYHVEMANAEINKATLTGYIDVYTNKKEKGFIGCFQDGKICKIVIKKCTNGRAVGSPLYNGSFGIDGKRRPIIEINDNSVIPFVNEIIRKYN